MMDGPCFQVSLSRAAGRREVMATCIYCALYDSKPVLSKNGRVMRNRVGRCLWLSTEPWPESVSCRDRRPTTRLMEPDEGKGCLCFKPLPTPGDG